MNNPPPLRVSGLAGKGTCSLPLHLDLIFFLCMSVIPAVPYMPIRFAGVQWARGLVIVRVN